MVAAVNTAFQPSSQAFRSCATSGPGGPLTMVTLSSGPLDLWGRRAPGTFGNTTGNAKNKIAAAGLSSVAPARRPATTWQQRSQRLVAPEIQARLAARNELDHLGNRCWNCGLLLDQDPPRPSACGRKTLGPLPTSATCRCPARGWRGNSVPLLDLGSGPTPMSPPYSCA